MQILWVSHAIPYPPKAGFLLRAFNLINELSKHHTVDLVAFVQKHWLNTLYGDVQKGIDDSRQALSKICREVRFLPIDNLERPLGQKRTALSALAAGSSYTGRWLHTAAAERAIGEMTAARRYDLVHFDTVSLAPFRHLAAGVPATLGHHNIESHLFTRRAQTEKGAFMRWYFEREGRLLAELERSTAPQFAGHITCSDLDSVRLHEVVGQVPTFCIPNGVDCDYFRSQGAAQKPQSLLFVGTMNWHPNSDAMQFLLQEVWPGLRAELPGVTLDIVGANAPQGLLALAAQSPGVTAHGFVPDVRPYFDAAELFVCPIRDGGGTKLKLLDAFAMGKAVLAHPIAMEGIDAVPGVHVELAETPEEFQRGIVALLADPERRRALGARARVLVEEKYSYQGIGNRLASTLEQLAATRQGAA